MEQQATLVRDDYHKLMRAFRAFDKEGKGFIELDALKLVLQTRGEAFSNDELNTFQAGLGTIGGRVYYEDYAHKLASSG